MVVLGCKMNECAERQLLPTEGAISTRASGYLHTRPTALHGLFGIILKYRIQLLSKI